MLKWDLTYFLNGKIFVLLLTSYLSEIIKINVVNTDWASYFSRSLSLSLLFSLTLTLYRHHHSCSHYLDLLFLSCSLLGKNPQIRWTHLVEPACNTNPFWQPFATNPLRRSLKTHGLWHHTQLREKIGRKKRAKY